MVFAPVVVKPSSYPPPPPVMSFGTPVPLTVRPTVCSPMVKKLSLTTVSL